MSEIVVLARAESQYLAEFARCLEFGLGRAEYFEAVVEEAYRQIALFPHSAPPFEAAFRRLVLADLPIAIFYVVEGRRVFIHGLLDSRQDPDWIRRELGL